jgi:AI-2 transport protein TqsA
MINNSLHILTAAILIALTIFALVQGKDLLVPIVLSIVIWYLIITLASLFQKISWKGYKTPYPIALGFSLLTGAFLLLIIINIISNNITEVVQALPKYQERMQRIMDNGFDQMNFARSAPRIDELLGTLNIFEFAGQIAQTVAFIASSLGVVIIYVLFLLWESHSFDKKLEGIIPDKKKLHDTQKLITNISKQIQSYIVIKTALSLLTATLSYIVLKAVGVDFAIFWAFVIFLLNYIPTFGSIIATILPCMLTIVQFDSWKPFLIVTSLLVSIQFIIGNILDPKLVGRTANLSGLAILLSFAFWSYIWGIAGMFLCVPLMVIANLIFANFPRTRPIAILLSEYGEINTRSKIE